MSKVMRSNKAEKRLTIVTILLIILIVLGVLVGITLAKTTDNKILKGTMINGVDVGNMDKEKAKETLKDYSASLANKEFKLNYDGSKLSFKGEDIDAKIDIDGSVDKAYDYGKSGDFLSLFTRAIGSTFGSKNNIEVPITINGESIKELVDTIVDVSGEQAVDGDYEEKEDTIIITKGHDGISPKYSEVEDQIKAEMNNLTEESEIKVFADISKAINVDLDALYKGIHVEKKNASYSKESGYVDAVDGVSFDLAKAKSEYANLKDGESMTIKLIITKPDITMDNLNDVLFADKLGTYTTNYNAANLNRSNNLQLAGKSINDVILKPDEEFSYNQTLGERTVKNGYKEAHVYSGGEVVDGLGGGICQISSTLYNAVLLANLEITSRTNHMFFPEYVKPSLDATVAWGSIDFKFKNSRETPIKIKASVSGGVATVSIYGLKVEGEPIVEIEQKTLTTSYPKTIEREDPTLDEGKKVTSQTPVNGYTSEAYRVLKDPKTKEVLSRTLLSKDTYKPTDKIVKVGTKKAEVVTPVEPEKPTPEPVTPATPVTPTEPETPPTPTVPTTPTQPENPGTNNGWPVGWDTPENPDYRG